MKRPTRRQFIEGMGASGLCLPILPSLFPSSAEAAVRPPLRFVLMGSLNGIRPGPYWPKTDPTTEVAPGVFGTKLSAIPGPVSEVFNAEMDDLRSRYCLIRGLGNVCIEGAAGSNVRHNRYATYSCSQHTQNVDLKTEAFRYEQPRVGSSVDNVIAYAPGFYANQPALRSLSINLAGKAAWSYYRKDGGRSPNVQSFGFLGSSAQVFNKVFPGTMAPVQVPSGSVTAYRGKVFESMLLQLERLGKSPSLSAADKMRVVTHGELINDLQKRVLAASQPASAPVTCDTKAPVPRAESGNALNTYANMTDAITTALACDLTRVVNLQLGFWDDAGRINWDNHHANSHGELANVQGQPLYTSDFTRNYMLGARWQANRVAGLMRKLASIKDADGSTLLDNTVLVWTDEHGSPHSVNGLPMFVAGAARGRLRMGEYLDYRLQNPIVTEGNLPNLNYRIGRPLNNLWTAVFRALDVPAGHYTFHGEDGGYGQAPDLTSKSYVLQFGRGSADAVSRIRRETLPYFFTE